MDSDEKKDVLDFKKRVRVAINKVACEKNLTNKSLATLLFTTPTTISNYRTMKNIAKAPFIVRFCEIFDCNKDWLFSGNGRPFYDSGSDYNELLRRYEHPRHQDPLDVLKKDVASDFSGLTGLYKKHGDAPVGGSGDFPPAPDADGSEPAPPHREEAPASAEARSAPIEFRISDALAMTARVLESRTSYATALYLNIVHFDRAVSSESIVSKCEEDLRAQGELLAKMQARLDDLESQNKTLTQEIRELKGACGDCPPIALGSEHAARTGTDE
ncbi:MAG TPA: hypothetical protein DCS11_06505 [Syntrophus sp. (in: bacteria)]|nr:hypothetical protein [Syntrophus sp. (in: bacteria)]